MIRPRLISGFDQSKYGTVGSTFYIERQYTEKRHELEIKSGTLPASMMLLEDIDRTARHSRHDALLATAVLL